MINSADCTGEVSAEDQSRGVVVSVGHGPGGPQEAPNDHNQDEI